MGCYLMCSAHRCGLQTIAACAFGLFKIKKGPWYQIEVDFIFIIQTLVCHAILGDGMRTIPVWYIQWVHSSTGMVYWVVINFIIQSDILSTGGNALRVFLACLFNGLFIACYNFTLPCVHSCLFVVLLSIFSLSSAFFSCVFVI